MSLVGISEIVRNSREVPGAGPQPFARLVQPAPLDEPLGTEPDPAPEQPLETALGDRESLAHLRDLTDVGLGLDRLDDGVDEQTLLVDRQPSAQGIVQDGG